MTIVSDSILDEMKREYNRTGAPVLRHGRVPPAVAHNWRTTRSIGNRRESPATIRQYKDEMDRNNWHAIASSPITFSDTGKLMNAHHRLHAAEQHGSPVDFYILYGEKESTMMYQDRGRPRSRGDNKLITTGDQFAKYREAAAKLILSHWCPGVVKPGGSLLDEVEAGFGGAFDDFLSIPGFRNKVAAPYCAAFLVVHGIETLACLQLASEIVARNTAAGTPANAISRLMGDPVNTRSHPGRIAAYKATVGGILKHISGEKCEFLRPNDTAVNYVIATRKRRGLYLPSVPQAS